VHLHAKNSAETGKEQHSEPPNKHPDSGECDQRCHPVLVFFEDGDAIMITVGTFDLAGLVHFEADYMSLLPL